MKQISEGETTTSSRPAFMGLTTASLMAPTVSSAHGMTADDLYHTARPRARHRHWTNVLRQSYSALASRPRRSARTATFSLGVSRSQRGPRARAGNRILPSMELPASSVVEFYNRHPISEGQVVDALRRLGKDLERLEPEDLYELDQDHYGGLEAVAALAKRARIDAASRVLDVCAGLAGPASFIARRWGARVTGIDLDADRAAGARRLTARVGLARLVTMVRGDAQSLPFGPAAFTAVVSQEGFLHVPDKARALDECGRVLVAGGRIAFSDWIATRRLGDDERRRLQEWMAAVTLQSIEGYKALLARAGFGAIEA